MQRVDYSKLIAFKQALAIELLETQHSKMGSPDSTPKALPRLMQLCNEFGHLLDSFCSDLVQFKRYVLWLEWTDELSLVS